MGRHAAWQSGLADQLFVAGHAVMDCARIAWDDGQGKCVPNEKAGRDAEDDGEWFEPGNGLDEATKTMEVEEVMMEMEDDDAGWNSEDEIDSCDEGDEEVLQQGRDLLLLHPDGDTSRTPRLRTQNPNHIHSHTT